MLGLRPTPTHRHVVRERLLNRLPDADGHVVWLQAPYGYGKSVLAAQWTERVAADGRRVVWTAPAGLGVHGALTRALALPADAPWGIVLDAAWAVPTVLVIEDLDGVDDLDPLLRRVDGLLLLASRGSLGSLELPRWATRGRLLELGATDLAFRSDEAHALFEDPGSADAAWRRTGGWPLPLHFAALTGSVPDRATLTEGVRDSVGSAAWREALLIATLDVLPTAHATEETNVLAAAGFLQVLDSGFRLHPLVAEAALGRHPNEARVAVAELSGRLPSLLRGRACLRVGHHEGLVAILEAPEDETYRAHPDTYLAWHAHVNAPAGTVRRCHAAVARILAGAVEEGVREAGRLIEDPGVPPRWQVRAAMAALFALAQSGRPDEAERFAAVADRHEDALPPFDRARVAQTRMILAHHLGDADAAERYLAAARAALRQATADPRHPESDAILAGNVAFLRWSAAGLAHAARLELRSVLDRAASARATGHADGLTPVTLGRVAATLATLEALAGASSVARALAKTWGPSLPGPDGFLLRVVGARAAHDSDALTALHAEAGRWERPDVADAAAANAALLARLRGEPPPAFVPRVPTGPLTRLEAAMARGVADDPSGALALLGDAPPADRGERLTWHAARFVATGDAAELDALGAASELGFAPLAHLGVPLDRLPRDRPETADAYPLAQVLASGWSEAIERRESEVPDLEVDLLGGVAAYVLGRPVDLPERQRQALALLALGTPRETIGVVLWPELDAARVRNNLNVVLSGLRRALQPWGRPTYLGDAGLTRTQVDVAALEVALAVDDAEEVARRYRGRLAADLDLVALEDAAAALEVRVVAALRRGAERRDGEPALALYDALLRVDPWDVEGLAAWVGQMLALGRRGDARRRWSAWVARWRREMELPLPPEVARLAGVLGVPSPPG
jgi:hypothetical protein